MIYTEEQTIKAISGESSLGQLYKLFRTVVDEPEPEDNIIKLKELKKQVEEGVSLKFDIFYLLKNRTFLVKNKIMEIEKVGRWDIREFEEEKYKRESIMRKVIAEHTESNKMTEKR